MGTKQFCSHITVYAGSADNLAPVYMQGAYQLGKTMAEQGRTLVFGAGKTGLMGAVADGVLEHGGKALGIINEALNLPHLAHANLSSLEIFPTIHRRQERMTALSDAMIALPGGLGTFAELFECLTWAQLNLHSKGLGFLNIHGYFDPLLAMLDRAISDGFVYASHRDLYRVSADPAELLAMLDAYQPPHDLNLWMERSE
ncbi:MAG: TIGR00730 family Rossman fold protein [Anaerolineaceae bacterium]|jgi:uncharacterized protein (TIGR00730 family)